MKNYYRVMLGRKSAYAQECLEGGFIGTDFGIREDLSSKLVNDLRVFNRDFVPMFLAVRPDKSRIAAGLAGSAVWTVAKGLHNGDIVLCPDGSGQYHVGEVNGEYYYQSAGILPHRRPVNWLPHLINRSDMSDGLKNSTGSIGTIGNISHHASEIESLLNGVALTSGLTEAPLAVLVSTDDTVEDPAAFAMEKHLEEFLISNWAQSELGREFDIYQDEDELGQQYPTDTGRIDILAISKDRKTLLVIELKKGRASDAVVGQILRYMGYVREELTAPGQQVRGAIIALEDDKRIRRALAMVPDIDFYRYQVSFKLLKM